MRADGTERAPGTDGPPARSRLSRRAAFGLGGTGALALLLAGCGDTVHLPSGIARVVESGAPLSTTPLAPAPDHLIELPGVQHRVRAVSLSRSLPLGPARSAGLEIPDGSEAEEVVAADGEQLLVADLERRPPSHLPSRPVPGTYAERVLLDGVEVARPVPDAAEPEPSGMVQILVSVPEGITPERIVLESSLDGITQQLSLLDGSRVSSDIEHVYAPRPDLAVAPNWWQRSGEAPRALLAGSVFSGGTAAVTPEGLWAAPESLMVCLQVCTYPQRDPGRSTLSLVLPDGSQAAPRGDHSTVFQMVEGGGVAWFEVPAAVESAIALVALGTGETDLGTVEIAVTLPRE